MKRFVIGVLLLCFVGAVGFAVTAHAATMTCTWTANTETDLAGYRLFQRTAGESYDYNAPVAQIPAGTEVCTLENIPDGDYRWVLRAFDTTGKESDDSNEVSKLINDQPSVVQGFG